MPLTDILAAIAAETDAAVSDIDDQSEQQARTIVAQARKRAAAEEQAGSDRRLDETALAVEQIVNGARLEADRLIRDTRAALYDEAHQIVVKRLACLRRTTAYPDILRRLVTEALNRVPEARVVRVVGDDVDLVRHPQLPEGTRVEGSLQGWGGVVAVGDGRLVDNTLEGRLRRADAELRRVAGDVVPQLRAGT